ncbi:hypothetical protein BX600DRAFT_440132 [Xylariales sp. PMI_506]|nr:hypothetical protein BX600DRAFT_440132 [Xylariales sp. PMI_506]
MASPPLPNTVPIRVFLASVQECSAHLYQWQAHAEAATCEIHSLRGRNDELQRENEDIRDCRDILQRMVDTQRELITSLEADLARSAVRHISSYVCGSSGPSSCDTLSPALDLTLTGSTEPLLPPVDPVKEPIFHKCPADIDIGGSAKRLHREDSGGVVLQLGDLLRSE